MINDRRGSIGFPNSRWNMEVNPSNPRRAKYAQAAIYYHLIETHRHFYWDSRRGEFFRGDSSYIVVVVL